jgi:hypothetical protein
MANHAPQVAAGVLPKALSTIKNHDRTFFLLFQKGTVSIESLGSVQMWIVNLLTFT